MTEEQQARYARAMHAMQSAVAYDIGRQISYTEAPVPVTKFLKHLRVGVNSAMADAGALTKLLIAKGVITRAEYFAAIVEAAEQEAEIRAAEVREKYKLPETVTFS